jgi:hypothetical protein
MIYFKLWVSDESKCMSNVNLNFVANSIIPMMQSMSEDQRKDYWPIVEKHYNLSPDQFSILKGKVLEILTSPSGYGQPTIPQQYSPPGLHPPIGQYPPPGQFPPFEVLWMGG